MVCLAPERDGTGRESHDARRHREHHRGSQGNGSRPGTAVAPKEMEAALELLGNYARQQLLQGHTVRLGDLGTLRVTFQSDGVENITDYQASSMIKNPRILFTPSKDFRESVINGLQFENGGVLENDVNYASLADYKKAKGITGGGTEPGGSSGGGGTEPGGEDPLG